jgi:AAA domain
VEGSRANRQGQPATPGQLIVHEDDLQKRFVPIDWADAFAQQFGPPAFLAGKWAEEAQQVSIIGDGKVGKTIWMHDFILSGVKERPFLGDGPRRPLKTLYFDRENDLRGIMRNLRSLGATDEDLKKLSELVFYVQFPKFTGQLDGEVAARELLTLVDFYSREGGPVGLVVLDTASRFIAGKENDSEPWLALYRLVHAELKGRGVAGVRLDHFGKDRLAGARGSSAKAQDIDHEWELTRLIEREELEEDGFTTVVTTALRMHRSETRSGIGPGEFRFTRVGRKREDVWLEGQTGHHLEEVPILKTGGPTDSLQHYVTTLLNYDAPICGRDRLREWAEQHRLPFPTNNGEASEVVRRYRAAKGQASPEPRPPRQGEIPF